MKPELVDALAPKIAEYANTQNPIQMADFSANDPFHIEFEKLSKMTWTPDGQAQVVLRTDPGQYSSSCPVWAGAPRRRAGSRRRPQAPQSRQRSTSRSSSRVGAASPPGQPRRTEELRDVHPTNEGDEAKTWKPDERFLRRRSPRQSCSKKRRGSSPEPITGSRSRSSPHMSSRRSPSTQAASWTFPTSGSNSGFRDRLKT